MLLFNDQIYYLVFVRKRCNTAAVRLREAKGDVNVIHEV